MAIRSTAPGTGAEGALRPTEAEGEPQSGNGHGLRGFLGRRRDARAEEADLDVPGVRARIEAYAVAALPTLPATERRLGGDRRSSAERRQTSIELTTTWAERRVRRNRRSVVNRRRYAIAAAYLPQGRDENER